MTGGREVLELVHPHELLPCVAVNPGGAIMILLIHAGD